MGGVGVAGHSALATVAGGGQTQTGQGRSSTLATAIGLVLAAHVAIGVGLWQAKFDVQPLMGPDQTVEARLVRFTPPPPPVVEKPLPKPKPSQRQAAPHLKAPALQPRPPVVPSIAPTVAPLEVAPVEHPIESAQPPVALAVVAPPSAPLLREPRITDPDWLRRPSADDIARYYPDRAQRQGVEGRATLSCEVDVSGKLQRCAVADETPGDQGFGKAALELSRQFLLKPMTRDGEAVEARIEIPLRFKLAEG